MGTLEFDNLVETHGLEALRQFFPFIGPHNLNDVVEVNIKADGSLISTFWHVGQNFENGMRLKTKGSLFSDQAVAAMAFLDREENRKFRDELATWTANGFTVNLEWCAPDNRVVIGYLEPALTVLNIRDNQCGTYYNVWTDLDAKMFPEMTARWIQRVDVADPVAFAEGIKDMTGVEGYVLKFKNGLWVKAKTLWYLTQHRAKDSINSDRRLFETVLSEATDDLRSLFFDDPLVIQRIGDMEKFVEHHYNHLVDTVERFYERNKDLERKEYAILGQKELNSMYFGLAMNRYTGKTVDYKAFMMRKYKEFGVKDDPSSPGDSHE